MTSSFACIDFLSFKKCLEGERIAATFSTMEEINSIADNKCVLTTEA